MRAGNKRQIKTPFKPINRKPPPLVKITPKVQKRPAPELHNHNGHKCPKSKIHLPRVAPHETHDKEFFQKCPICQECFGMENIVVLSCGHTVHVVCLMSFRRFTRDKEHRCPVCRQQYEFVRMKAETEHFNRCAMTIQRVFRGYLVRRRLKDYVQPGSPLHRRWVLSRAERASNRLACAIEDQSDAVDAILANIEKELDWARNIMKAVEERGKTVDWATIRSAIAKKGALTCPICLRMIRNEECTITSCSHFFHKQCIAAWIQFCSNAGNNTICPCCRGAFQHTSFIQQPTMPKIDNKSLFCM